ncbi:MAG: tetratricopeptide repeat protein [Treponema sp.]
MLPILVSVIAAALLVMLLMVLSGRKSEAQGKQKTPKAKNRNTVIKDCTKKLAHDPRNINALTSLGDLYYTEKNYEKAQPLYATLFSMVKFHPEIDPALIPLRFGICSYKQKKLDEALQGLAESLKSNSKSFDANFYMSRLMFEKKDFERALLCARRASAVDPENTEAQKILGSSLYGLKKYKECLPHLKKVIDENPADKEALFYIASAMEDTGMADKALKIFMHLRSDPTFGAQSCIAAGTIHDKMHQSDKAVLDYEIALKLENILPETRLTIYYKLAQAYLAQQNIAKALQYLKQIQALTPSYKDVNALVARYQELNQNSNLQSYLMAGTSEFVALCRKFVSAYYHDAYVKIEDVITNSDSVDVLCAVETSRWEDNELFRFYRTTGAIGELYIRDFHSKMRDTKVDRGFCLTAGAYTSEAQKYVEGRPIDLLEKQRLVAILKKIDMNR